MISGHGVQKYDTINNKYTKVMDSKHTEYIATYRDVTCVGVDVTKRKIFSVLSDYSSNYILLIFDLNTQTSESMVIDLKHKSSTITFFMHQGILHAIFLKDIDVRHICMQKK